MSPLQLTTLQVGQCLPESCSLEDVDNILSRDPGLVKFNQQQNGLSNGMPSEEAIVFLSARKVPGSYRLSDDKRFVVFG